MSDNNRSGAANIPDFEQRRRLRRKRRRRRRMIALTTTIILLILAALAFTFVYAYRDFAGLGGDGKSFTIDIPENADADSVAVTERKRDHILQTRVQILRGRQIQLSGGQIPAEF